jgi:soluble lytic murein transglycosylase
MQLTEETFDWVGWRLGEETAFDDAFDPQTNLRYGVYLLSYLLELFEDEETALAAYHAGAGIVQRWLSDERYSADGRTLTEIPYADTAQYVPRVIQAKKTYQHLYGKGL